MCGICGVWEYGAAAGRVDVALVDAMRDRMPHRGPDDVGAEVFDGGRLGLGFRRLSIIDLSPAGHQPMRGCEGSGVWLVFNGEIYNHAELRAGLEQRGHRYRSRTDSETIIHLYEERGLDFVKEIEGDYAIAIWDEPRGRLVLARDRVGVKPLYYYLNGGRLIFASEIKAILAHPEVSAELDEESLQHYLSFLTTPAPRTLFRGVGKLPAGHMLVCGRDGEVKTIRYWDALPPEAPANGARHKPDEEYRADILRLLRESIKKRMMADVPFGVFLSGGVDSSANVALMAEQMSRPVETFTVAYKDHEELNELESARDISSALRGRATTKSSSASRRCWTFCPTSSSIRTSRWPTPSACRSTTSQGSRASRAPSSCRSARARTSCSAATTSTSSTCASTSASGATPRRCRPSRGARRAPSHNLSSARRRARPRRRNSRGASARASRSSGARPSSSTRRLKVSSSPPRRARASTGLSSYEVVKEELERVARERPASDFLARMTYLELKLRLPELLLMRVDKMTMATSVEARVPFLDQHLVEYAMGVPRALKVEGRSGKHVLKRALEEVLPRDVLYRRKRGFGAPVEGWFRGASAAELESRVMNSSLRRRGLLDYTFVARLFEEHRRGARDWGFHLWALLNLSLWYDRWIDSP